MRPARLLMTAAAITAVWLAIGAAALQQRGPYEVWAADQNGNDIYVLDPDGRTLRTIDVEALATGRRPHTIHTSADGRWLFTANTVSGQALVHALPGGEVVSRIDGVGKSPHAVQPHPTDPSKAYVSNIGPQARDSSGRADQGETITEISRGADGRWSVSRRLDLRAERVLADTARFPSRRPVLVGFSRDGRQMLVTMFHGGIAVVDLAQWRVVEAWGSDRVGHHATVAAASPDRRELYVTAGSANTSWLAVIDVSGSRPELVITHDLARWGFDAHGAMVRPGTRELWVVHRASGTVTIHPLDRIREAHTPAVLSLNGEIPDLIEFSPDGARAFITLRGPRPAPTIPFPLAGRTPGVAFVDAARREVKRVVPLGDAQESDFHGIAIVR